jgi:hypothetical protein
MTVTGQLVALGVVLLPVIGVAVRLVAFEFEPRLSNIPLIDLAIAAPIGSLTALGLDAVLLPAILVALVQLLLWFDRIESEKTPARRGGSVRKLIVPKPVFYALLAGGVVLTFFRSPWPVLLSVIPAYVASIVMARSISNRRFSFSRSWFPLVLLAATWAAVAGLTQVGPPAGWVTLAGGTGRASGSYSIIGSEGDFSYLLPCSPAHRLTSISNDRINSIAYYPRRTVTQPTAFDVIFEGAPSHAGVSYSCLR